MIEIYVKVVACKDKNGKAFNAYETIDRSGNKVNIRFVLGTTPITESCTIALLDYWQDKRKAYPTLRVKDYKVVETKKETKTTIEF